MLTTAKLSQSCLVRLVGSSMQRACMLKVVRDSPSIPHASVLLTKVTMWCVLKRWHYWLCGNVWDGFRLLCMRTTRCWCCTGDGQLWGLHLGCKSQSWSLSSSEDGMCFTSQSLLAVLSVASSSVAPRQKKCAHHRLHHLSSAVPLIGTSFGACHLRWLNVVTSTHTVNTLWNAHQKMLS